MKARLLGQFQCLTLFVLGHHLDLTVSSSRRRVHLAEHASLRLVLAANLAAEEHGELGHFDMATT